MGGEDLKTAKKLAKKLGREPTAAEVAAAVLKKEKKASKAETPVVVAATEPVVVASASKKTKKRKAEGAAVVEAAVVEAAAASAPKKVKKAKKDKTAAAAAAAPAASSAALTVTQSVEAWRLAKEMSVEPDNRSYAPAQTWEAALKCIKPELVKRCQSHGWPTPTPIQSQVWPILATGRDVVAIAETGSGKTLGFALPALTEMPAKPLQRSQPSMLALAPTRELAQQSYEVIEEYCAVVGCNAAIAYGGVPKHEQKKAISTCSALVATPGRLKDLADEGAVDLSMVTFFALDEADRMLDMGFVHVVRAISEMCGSALPATRRRRTVMFSATWPSEVRAIASEFLSPDHVRIAIGGRDRDDGEGPAANKRITQEVRVVEERGRDSQLLDVLKKRYKSGSDPSYKAGKLIVFGLYKKECARLETMLERQGWKAVAIHGDMSQPARTAAFENFKAGKVPLLVATDVAARGLDIPNVELVVNFSFPLTIEDYARARRVFSGAPSLSPKSHPSLVLAIGHIKKSSRLYVGAPHRPHGPRGQGRRGHHLLPRRRPREGARRRPAKRPARRRPARARRAPQVRLHRQEEGAQTLRRLRPQRRRAKGRHQNHLRLAQKKTQLSLSLDVFPNHRSYPRHHRHQRRRRPSPLSTRKPCRSRNLAHTL